MEKRQRRATAVGYELDPTPQPPPLDRAYQRGEQTAFAFYDPDVCKPEPQRLSVTALPKVTAAAIDVLSHVQVVLAEKSKYYGDSIGNPVVSLTNQAAETKLLVRMEDKLARITRGTGDNTDAWIDLIGYAALLLAMREEGTTNAAP